MSKRSRCGGVRILLSLGEPSAEIVRVEAPQSTAQSTCVQQLAESNLRAAAWNNAACADRFREKSRGAVRAKHIAPSRLVQSQLAQCQLRRATREK